MKDTALALIQWATELKEELFIQLLRESIDVETWWRMRERKLKENQRETSSALKEVRLKEFGGLFNDWSNKYRLALALMVGHRMAADFWLFQKNKSLDHLIDASVRAWRLCPGQIVRWVVSFAAINVCGVNFILLEVFASVFALAVFARRPISPRHSVLSILPPRSTRCEPLFGKRCKRSLFSHFKEKIWAFKLLAGFSLRHHFSAVARAHESAAEWKWEVGQMVLPRTWIDTWVLK